MRKIDLLYGTLIGFATCILGTFIFLTAFTDHGFVIGIKIMRMQGNLGKLLTLGAILSVVVFFVLLRFNKDLMARGVILALIILSIMTLFL
jgi:hypothetical protein